MNIIKILFSTTIIVGLISSNYLIKQIIRLPFEHAHGYYIDEEKNIITTNPNKILFKTTEREI